RTPTNPYAFGAGLHGGVRLLCGFVGVRAQQMPGTPCHPRPGSVLVSMIVVVLAVLMMAVAGGARVRVAHNPEGARKTALQHIANSQRGAAATSSQDAGARRD